MTPAQSKYQMALQRYGIDYFRRKQREWKARNPEVAKEWRRKNPALVKEVTRESSRRHWRSRSLKSTQYHRDVVYPTVELERERLIGRPRPDVCELCSRSGRISFDHCHQTGKARGWLCGKCNTALGMVGDDAELLRKLAAYVEAHQ